MNNTHYKDIVFRTSQDTGLELETVDIIAKCLLYELAEELVIRNAVELPYIGDISLRNKSLNPNKFIKSLNKSGGSYAIKFRHHHEEALKRNREQRNRDSGES